MCIVGGWNQGPLDTAATNGLLCQPRMIMIGRGNRSTRRKPAPVQLCPPQTPHAARTRTRAAVVGSQRLTAWATARRTIILTWASEEIERGECGLDSSGSL
jgi:hypothetical protein